MMESDAYLRQAAVSFQYADERLKEAEEQLNLCVRLLEESTRMVQALPEDELTLWGQVDSIVNGHQPPESRELEKTKSG